MVDVLVTGSGGAIGRVVAAALRGRGHRVRGFDRSAPTCAGDIQGELNDARALRDAAAGMRVLVHLAATPDESTFAADLVPNNVVGTYHLLEAARECRAARVVLASTLRVLAGGDHRFMAADARLRPHDLYSWTKAGAELMGELYASRHGLSVIAARIGMFPRDRREWERVAGWTDRRSYIGWADARRFFTCAVEAELGPGFHALYAVGGGGSSLVDLEAGRQRIGFVPHDTWPDGTPELSGSAERP